MNDKNNNLRIILEDEHNEFSYKKNKSNLNVLFNRVAFIFFIFFFISLIYSINLIHLGSRKNNNEITYKPNSSINKLYRANFVDRNNQYIGKTVSSIDIGISTRQVINKKKLILNLKYIFPDKNYEEIKSKLDKKKFFYF